MTEKYLSLSGECKTEKIIEKSKFITTSAHTAGEEQAKRFISEVSQKYRDATHNCYAYIADNNGNFPRFSDDGEPQGTAGMPMLEVIKNNKLYEVAVVVTRYFGGIKLGAGGLVRAYSGCVAENLASARKASCELCVETRLFIAYPLLDSALRYCKENGADLINTEYLDETVLTALIKKSIYNDFIKGLTNRLNGKLRTQISSEYIFPFEM